MKRLLILSFMFLFTIPCFAANHYILDGGSGDGSAWNNAWDDLPATLTRGDTYYIGDGTYGGYTFNDAVSGTDIIYIKKATAGDHGTETGWSRGDAKNGADAFSSVENTIPNSVMKYRGVGAVWRQAVFQCKIDKRLPILEIVGDVKH